MTSCLLILKEVTLLFFHFAPPHPPSKRGSPFEGKILPHWSHFFPLRVDPIRDGLCRPESEWEVLNAVPFVRNGRKQVRGNSVE